MGATEATPKLRRDAQRNHDKIVAAARELFTKRGIDISLDDIARHAGVGVATAYRHFPDKDQLVDAVFADAMARTVALAEDAAARERAWDGLVTWLENVGEMQAADTGLRTLMKSHSRGGAHAQRAHDQIAQKLTELLERAIAEGDLRADLELSDLGACIYMLSAAIDLTDPVVPGTWRRYLDLLLDGMRSSRSGPCAPQARALSREEMERAMTS
jgi:AcrR family transcriptional regulator